MTSESLLHIVDLHKRYDALEVLKGIDLDVVQGEVVALIGSSGSGKTTLLRCINMLETFQAGEIHVDGESIGYRKRGEARLRLSEREIARQRAKIGMVFQSFNLFPHMTAEQNVMLGLTKVQGKPVAEARDIAEKWLARVGLADKRQNYPFQLSGGQQQRVAIARAVAMEPKLLLFDEVTSALDPELVQEVLAVMQDLARLGMTMLVVSHEMLFVREVASRVVFMDAGRIAADGPPKTLFANPGSERLATFLGRFHGVFA
ncbi:MAG: amino acid ABC transporter ATP-binding protein [Alphaproteobacteria bacterium]